MFSSKLLRCPAVRFSGHDGFDLTLRLGLSSRKLLFQLRQEQLDCRRHTVGVHLVGSFRGPHLRQTVWGGVLPVYAVSPHRRASDSSRSRALFASYWEAEYNTRMTQSERYRGAESTTRAAVSKAMAPSSTTMRCPRCPYAVCLPSETRRALEGRIF